MSGELTRQPLARVASLKVKLGLLVAASATVAAVVASVGDASGVPRWLGIPVTIGLALALTQLLAVGMTSPLRQMTRAARRMARGDYDVRISDSSRDEVGELARAFNTMAHDLAGVDRQRRDLVANVSHELRTPLAGLRAVLENVVDGVAPRDPAALATALAQAERLSGLVDDLLDLARVDAGRAPLVTRPVAVADLLDEAVAEARALGRQVGYDVRVEPPGLVVTAGPARLHQLVANLLDNASRHSPAGGTVAVEVTRQDTRYVIEVRDDGPGVPAADRERVFEPFGTLGGPAGGGGTGLGLAIARWVSDLHGGEIRFAEPGAGGARVVVALPLEPAARPPRPVTVPAFGPDPGRALEPDPQPSPQPSAQPSPQRSSESSRRPSQEDPVPSSPAPPPPAAPPTASAPAAAPHPSVSDELLGGFWPDAGVPARVGLLLGAAGVGVLGGLVLPERALGLGTFLVLLAAGAVVLAASRDRRDPFTLACAGLCLLLAGTTLLRDAEWVVVACLLAGAAVCVCGVTRGRTLGGFVVAGLTWPLAGIRGLPWLGRTLAALPVLGHGMALVRTALWSLAGLVVFGALFASADALVAEWVDAVVPDLARATLALRAFVAVGVGGTVLAAAYLALNPPRVDAQTGAPAPVARRYEWLVPVGVVAGVFAVFLAAQATVAFGGHDYLRRTTGLTYAEYVHEGFAQLTIATVLTLLVIWAAARKASRETVADRAWLRLGLGVLCVETLVVVASALDRMQVYQEAYGFTRMRLLVDVFEGWLGLLVLAVLVSGVALSWAWLPRFALLSGAVALLGLAVADPDAWIARHNLDRYAETGRVDWTYLAGLSDDAVPVLSDLPEDERRCALGGRDRDGGDWLEWNLGRSRASSALEAEPAGPRAPVGVCAEAVAQP